MENSHTIDTTPRYPLGTRAFDLRMWNTYMYVKMWNNYYRWVKMIYRNDFQPIQPGDMVERRIIGGDTLFVTYLGKITSED